MIRLGLIMKSEDWPYGLRCQDCDKVVEPGDEYADRLSGMIEDVPLLEVVCGVCGRVEGT